MLWVITTHGYGVDVAFIIFLMNIVFCAALCSSFSEGSAVKHLWSLIFSIVQKVPVRTGQWPLDLLIHEGMTGSSARSSVWHWTVRIAPLSLQGELCSVHRQWPRSSLQIYDYRWTCQGLGDSGLAYFSLGKPTAPPNYVLLSSCHM